MPRKAKSSKGGERKRAPSWKVSPRLPWLRQEKSQCHHSRLQPCLLTRLFLTFIGRQRSTSLGAGSAGAAADAEKGLRFQLEVQKLRNTITKLVWKRYRTGLIPHGAWLLQSNCSQTQVFQLTPQVATGTEKLGRAVQVVECSLFKDVLLPSPELFDELWDLVLSSLLPF